MKLIFRLLAVALVTVLVFIVAGVVATWAPDQSVESLSAQWALPPSQFVVVNGLSVHLRDEGPRNDPLPLILLHGTSASLHTWDGWVEGLHGKRRVIRFDLPAFGLTGPTADNDYSIAAYVRWVGAVADTLGVETFALAGNSLGGEIAWATAAALPQRVRKLILVDSGGYAFKPREVPIGFRIARVPGLRRLAELVLPRGVVEKSMRSVYGDPDKVTPALVDRYYALTLRAGNRKALGYRVDQLMQTDFVKSRAIIQSLKLPVLVLWGGRDRLIPPENGVMFSKDIVGAQHIEFEDLGHVPQEEDPFRTLKPVIQFLNQP